MKLSLNQLLNKSAIVSLLIFLFAQLNSATAGIPSKAHGARESRYDVKFYFLDLDIERATDNITGNVLVRATSLVNNLDTFSLELASNLTVDSVKVTLNGSAFQSATSSHIGIEVNIFLPFVAGINDTVQTRVYYHGTPSVGDGVCGNYTGFFKETPPFACTFSGLDSHKFSGSPPYNSATWWPCKQWLTDKADSSWFYITTAKADYTASNGLLADTVTVGAKKTWKWKSKYPIDFYLISFVVTPAYPVKTYWHPANRTDSMLLLSYDANMTGVTTALQIYSNLFGLYPFYDEKLGIANVDLGGGMENQSMIAEGDQFGAFAPHEIAHQWWGDNVTCGSWKDVMLNEGFAQWSQYIYAEKTSAKPDSVRKKKYSDNTSTTPVYGVAMDTATVSGVFLNQSIYYEKAAMVINSLRFTINNDSIFFLGLRNYQTQFGGKSALASDLKAVMETTSGINLTDFFNQWYYKGGAPTFNLTWGQINNILYLRIRETTNLSTNPLFKTPVEITVKRTQGDTTVRLMVLDSISNFEFYCPGNITGFAVDTNQWITNGKGTVTHDQTVAVLSISNGNNTFKLYPNPATNTFVIKGEAEMNIRIYNTLGMLVYTEEHYMPGDNVDASGLKAGIYFVHAADAKREEVIKLLIER